MNIESLRDFCKSLPGVTEDIKWKSDLCFLVGGKIFCITGFETPMMVSIKVTNEEFEEMSVLDGIVPAPYLAKYKWVLVHELALSDKEWKHYLRQSYDLIKAKLPPKKLKEFGLSRD